MKISAKLSIIFAAIFAILCLSVAITGFTSLDHIVDPQQLADPKGFAWFWTFLAAVSVALGALSYWIVRTTKDDE